MRELPHKTLCLGQAHEKIVILSLATRIEGNNVDTAFHSTYRQDISQWPHGPQGYFI